MGALRSRRKGWVATFFEAVGNEQAASSPPRLSPCLPVLAGWPLAGFCGWSGVPAFSVPDAALRGSLWFSW